MSKMAKNKGFLMVLTLAVLSGLGANTPQNWLISAAYAENAPTFLVNIPDVPLMDGMTERHDQGFVFDAPEGRVAQSVVLYSRLTPENIMKFYKDALPQLGWKAQKTGVFKRGSDQLTVKIDKVDGRNVVVFDLAPESDQNR